MRRLAIGVSVGVLFSSLLVSRPAHAVGWSLRLEASAAGPLEKPQRDQFTAGGAGGVHLGLAPVGFFELQLAAGFLGLKAASRNPNDDPGLAYSVGGGVRFLRPWSAGIVSPWIDADIGYVRSGELNRFGFSVGGGVSFALNERRTVRLGPYLRYQQIVTGSRVGYDDTDAKVLIGGLALEVGSAMEKQGALPGDRDGDGIPDGEDRCPDQAEDRDGFEDQDGCPELDNDKDGIPYAKDKCPNQPEDKDGYQDDDGCPDPDNDGDGIPDGVDKCPSVAEDKDGFEDQDGCPELDNDKDGLPDDKDACPNLPGTEESGGCPDRDGDHTDDQHDECPDTPGPPETHGCPEYKKVKVTANKLELSEKIFFAHDMTRILPKSFPLLDEVGKVLKDHPALRVRIEGHTDSQGSLEHNQQLSQGRAQAVRDYLVSRGIVFGRLDVHGYGPELPIDTNKTVAGRENNRRVEFVILTEGAK